MVGGAAQDVGHLDYPQYTSPVQPHMAQDPSRLMSNAQYSMDQGGPLIDTGDQTMLDAQLPTPATFEQGTQSLDLF